MAQRDSYFISRLQSQTALFDPDTGQRLDLAQQVRRQCTTLKEYQWQIGQRVHLPVRVILRRVPDAVAQHRRRKAKQKARKQKKNCTTAYLTLLAFDLFITNVPASALESETVCLLYRVRWQAELQFKAWKSQLAVGVLGDWQVERVLCYLYAHFLGIVLLHLWLAPYRALPEGELSWTKAIQVLQKTLPALLDAISAHWEGVCRFFQRLDGDLQRFARKDKRRKSPSTFSRLLLVKP